MEDQLYPFYNTLNYIHSHTFCMAKEALNALKSTTKSSSDAWNLNIPASSGRGSFRNMSPWRNMYVYIYIYIFVKNKFTGVLQPFVIPDFSFISIQIIHYFSCVIRNTFFPASFTNIHSCLATSPTAKHSSLTFAISFSLTSTYP